MKRILIFIAISTWMISGLSAQITVNQADMPAAGDTLRVSLTNFVPSGYWKTAMDTAWNYAALEALNQRVDTFVSATSTPVGYQLFFVLLGGANLASPIGSIPVPGLPATQGFTFCKNNSGSFSDLGSAYTIQGIPIPAKYDVPDKLYQFPLVPGTAWSSVSSFAITIPNLAFYGTQRVRSSQVDGWGTLTTPFGTFQTLRVKSSLAIHDSLYIDSLGIGFPVNRNITEYKWLANGKGIPVLQINEEAGIATATYRDIYRLPLQSFNVSLGPDTAVYKGTVLTLHASVTGGTPPYRMLWNTLDTGETLTVTVQDVKTYSVFVVDAVNNSGYAQKVVSIKYHEGTTENEMTELKVFPNPGNGKIQVAMKEPESDFVLEVISPQGKIIREQKMPASTGNITADFSGLPAGLYLLRAKLGNKTFTAKFQLLK